MAKTALQGNPVSLSGELPAVGSQAPEFHLVAKDLSDKTLADFAGKKKLLNIVPSLDTGVCAASTKTLQRGHGRQDRRGGPGHLGRPALCHGPLL